MGRLPFSYYLAVRDSYLREQGLIRPAKPKSDQPFEVEGDLDAYRS